MREGRWESYKSGNLLEKVSQRRIMGKKSDILSLFSLLLSPSTPSLP